MSGPSMLAELKFPARPVGYRDGKLALWTIYPPGEGRTQWTADSGGYGGPSAPMAQVVGKTREGVRDAVEAYASDHDRYFSKSDGATLGGVGAFVMIAGGSVAAMGALVEMNKTAKAGGAVAALGAIALGLGVGRYFTASR
jgi:hypothetical protein